MLYVGALVWRLADILKIKVFEVKGTEPTNETAFEPDIESEKSERHSESNTGGRSDAASRSQAMFS